MKTDQLLSLPKKIKCVAFPKKQTPIIFFVYLIFFLFLLIQHSMVFPYHDDWGLAVLDYVGEQKGFTGQNFKFSQVLGFLAGMYKNWTGRVFPFFLEIYLFKFGIWYLRSFQVLTILIVVFYSMKIASNCDGQNKRSLLVWVLPITLYLALPPEILTGGIYWFTAAANYLWGVPVLLFAANSIVNNKKVTVGSCLLLAASAVFHEQMGIAVIAFFVCYIVCDYFFGEKKQRTIEKFYFLAPVVILAALTILAPGNFRRKRVSSYVSESMTEIVQRNITDISEMLFAQGTIFFWILVLSFISLSLGSIKSPVRFKRDLIVPCSPVIALLVAYFLLPKTFFSIFFIGLFSYILFKTCKLNNVGIIVFSVFVASIASLVPLLLAPEVSSRSFIPFYLLLFVPILFSIMAIKEEKIKWLAAVALCVILAFSIISSANTFNGYRSNYLVNTLNHYQLMIASYKIKNNIDTEDKVILFKLPSPIYAETMPYQRPLIEKWMKKYYELPQDFKFDWR